jgi:hypothetical protein
MARMQHPGSHFLAKPLKTTVEAEFKDDLFAVHPDERRRTSSANQALAAGIT